MAAMTRSRRTDANWRNNAAIDFSAGHGIPASCLRHMRTAHRASGGRHCSGFSGRPHPCCAQEHEWPRLRRPPQRRRLDAARRISLLPSPGSRVRHATSRGWGENMGGDGTMILEAALACRVAGLSVLPAHLAEKRPALSGWKPFQEHLPGKEQVCAWFKEAEAICIVTGKVSGNLEMMDFDNGGELFDRWAGAVKEQSPGLIDRLVIESSQSGGRHVAYRCRDAVCGNLKLAQRRLETPGGKQYVHRKDADGNQHVIQTLIETRGEGGLFLCAPSPGYKLLQGDFTHLPVLTPGERDVLLSAAWALNEYIPPPEPIPTGCASLARPGDDYSARGDVRAVLVKHGWTLAKPGENEYWRRPGKTNGWSATLKDRIFYVFSSNAAPFEPNKAYSPFAVYAHLEHNGDFAAAARALRAEGYGGDEPAVNLTGIVAVAEVAPPAEPTVPDPGQMPEDLLRVPGFVSEEMDYCLQTAPYPNTVMAFCGALALQAFLAGRKVRDPGDNRT
ncbi:MAG TPA: hypothetical protein ENN81_11845, partial [Phycisphaerales bacterium]|nr:hypothetical protein [Phycisphaerales bacterium]